MNSSTNSITMAVRNTAVFLGKWVDNLLFKVWGQFNKNPIVEKPVFIIGCPRSGTSIAVELFTIHPYVANWSEAGEVWDTDTYYDPEADHHWHASVVADDDATRLHAWFEYYRQKNRKQRFVNKHPRNSVRIDYINRIFPDAFFIHVIRDGRAVVNSIVHEIQKEPRRQGIPFGNFCKPPDWRRFLRDDPVEQAALQWREIVSFIIDQQDKLENRYYKFKYEDLCLDPRKTLASLFSFVGLPATEETMADIPEKLENMNFKYKEELSQDQIETINRVQGKLLRELGYLV